MFAFYFPSKVFPKINKTGVEVIETPKLNKECFSFVAGQTRPGRDILLDINGAATTLVLGAALSSQLSVRNTARRTAGQSLSQGLKHTLDTAVCSLAASS